MVGSVIWITGMSAAGKTTVSRQLLNDLKADGVPAVLVDGDEVREMVGDECGHHREDRIRNAYRICRLALLLARQDMTVIVATMSLFHEVHQWNRENLPGYFEVLLEADMKTLKERDPKGLYASVECGNECNLSGVDLTAELPKEPHLHIINNGNSNTVPDIVLKILSAFQAS